ncbi:MAG: PQQ-dependent sugar dehydrogenase [Bacteroidota bacterium]
MKSFKPTCYSGSCRLTWVIALGWIVIALLYGCSSDSSHTDLTTSTDISKLAFAEDNGSINLPDGFQAVVVAEDLGRARHLVVRDNGDVYVALRRPKDGKGIAALRDTDGDGVADEIKYFSKFYGTGIDIRDGYLYFGSDTEVVRYPFDGDALLPSMDYEVVVQGFKEQSQHAVKPFTFDQQGKMYVNVGAPSNACMEEMRTKGSPGMDPCPLLERHGGIWQFDADKLNQDQMRDGKRYATGIRNAVALDWNHQADNLYALQHGRDQLNQFFPDMYSVEDNAELPAEEFFKVDEGDNFGWPYAYYDQRQGKKVLMPEYGGDGQKVGRASEFEDPILAFPGHWAPNDLMFYSGNQFPASYSGGAFIAFHGSWNRAPLPQRGYNVVFVPFNGDMPSGDDYQVFADGFKGTEELASPGDAEYRPMGLDMGPDGSLYISDSVTGKIWRVVYTGS